MSEQLLKTAIEELQWHPYQEREQRDTTGLLNVIGTKICPRILLSQSGEALEEIPLEKRLVSIGRSINNDITLGHRLVSRYHAQITIDHDRIFLEDLGSRNGTYINGKRTTKCSLRNRDRIRIGTFELELATGPANHTLNEVTKLAMVPGK